LQILSERKIKTYVFFGPILPYISDIDLENYFKTISKLGIEYIYIDKLNLKPGIWDNLEKILEINYPELIDKWKEIFFLKNNYYEEIRKKIIKLCEENGIKYIFCY
jgi:DNA repair photolyase